jgi:tetrahydromethanopterin S-methyltransferase subunit D
MRRWSFGILAVAILRIVDAAGRLAVGLGLHNVPVNGVPIIAANPELTRGVDLLLAGATVIGVVGLLLYQRWGWVVTMVLVGVELALGLIRVWLGLPDYVTLLVLVITTFYLNQRSVRAMVNEDPGPEPRTQPLADDD